MLLILSICRTCLYVQQFGTKFFEQRRAMRDSGTGVERYFGFGACVGLSPSFTSEFAPSSFLFLLLAPTPAPV